MIPNYLYDFVRFLESVSVLCCILGCLAHFNATLDGPPMGAIRWEAIKVSFDGSVWLEFCSAPLRLFVGNQLGFRMVKWIQSIEFVSDYRHVYMGEGEYNSNHEYFDSTADI